MSKPLDFAGFSAAEWQDAFSIVMSRSEALDEVERLFAAIGHQGSTGFSISSHSLALLSLVNSDCKRRVEVLLATLPETTTAEVQGLRSGFLENAFPYQTKKFTEKG